MIVATVGFEGGYIFYNACLADVSTPRTIGWISGLGWGIGFLGGLGALLACAPWLARPLVHGTVLDPLAVHDYRISFLVVAAYFAIFALPALLLLPQSGTPRRLRSLGAYAHVGFGRVRETLTHLRRYRDAAAYVTAALFFYGGIETVIKFSAIYAAVSFGIQGRDLILLFVVTNLVAAPGTILAGLAADRFGGRRTLALTLAGWVVLVLGAAFVESATEFWIVACGLAVGMGSTQAIGRSFMAEIAPPAREAEFFGFYVLCSKIGSIARAPGVRPGLRDHGEPAPGGPGRGAVLRRRPRARCSRSTKREPAERARIPRFRPRPRALASPDAPAIFEPERAARAQPWTNSTRGDGPADPADPPRRRPAPVGAGQAAWARRSPPCTSTSTASCPSRGGWSSSRASAGPAIEWMLTGRHWENGSDASRAHLARAARDRLALRGSTSSASSSAPRVDEALRIVRDAVGAIDRPSAFAPPVDAAARRARGPRADTLQLLRRGLAHPDARCSSQRGSTTPKRRALPRAGSARATRARWRRLSDPAPARRLRAKRRGAERGPSSCDEPAGARTAWLAEQRQVDRARTARPGRRHGEATPASS